MPIDPRIEAALNAPLRKGSNSAAIVSPRARVPKGYGGVPGTGPVGKTCHACRECQPTGSDYRDWFCNAPRRAHERGTFINRSTKACSRFKARKGQE